MHVLQNMGIDLRSNLAVCRPGANTQAYTSHQHHGVDWHHVHCLVDCHRCGSQWTGRAKTRCYSVSPLVLSNPSTNLMFIPAVLLLAASGCQRPYTCLSAQLCVWKERLTCCNVACLCVSVRTVIEQTCCSCLHHHSAKFAA